MTVALAILTIPVLGAAEYWRHRVASRRRAHRALHAEVARFLTPGGSLITRTHRAMRRYGQHRAYDE